MYSTCCTAGGGAGALGAADVVAAPDGVKVGMFTEGGTEAGGAPAGADGAGCCC